MKIRDLDCWSIYKIICMCYLHATVNVLKFRTLFASQKGLDKQRIPRSEKQSDQGLPCLVF